MRFLALALLGALLSQPAAAQSWDYGVGPTGKAAFAYLDTAPLTQIILNCTLPDFDPAEWARVTGENHGAQRVPPGQVMLEISESTFPQAAAADHAAAAEPPRTVLFRIDGRDYPVGNMRLNLVDAVFYAFIPINAPLLGALKSGSQVTVSMAGESGGLTAGLRGSSASIGAMQQFCAAGTARSAEAAGAPAGGAALAARDHGVEPDAVAWVDVAGSNPAEALAFISTWMGGNAMSLEVVLYRASSGRWQKVGTVQNVFGLKPRNARRVGNEIEVVTTMKKPDEPRCCPTGIATYRIDPGSLKGRQASLR